MTIGGIQTNANAFANAAAPTAAGNTGSAFSSLLKHAVSAGTEPTAYDVVFQRAAQRYGVPVGLLKAVAKAESNYHPKSVSRCGAQGIMQLMPATAQGLGVTDPLDPEQNIMGGAKYLSDKLRQYDGSVELALAAYNAGSGNVAKYGGVPPFTETQNYIRRVLGYAGMEPGAAVPAAANAEDLSAQLGLSALGLLGGGSADSSGTGLLSPLAGGASPLASLYALSLLANGDNSGGAQDSLAGLLGASGAGGLTSQNYLSLLRLVAAQMQSSAQPLASDLTSPLSGSAGSML